MARSKTSKHWLQEHFDDSFVQQAQRDGYRSRAAYKLQEIDTRDGLLKPGMTVVDLGAAPGGWSQVAAERVGESGRVIASDILPMDAVAGVQFAQGDFTQEAVYRQLQKLIDGAPVDLVISDMAPNLSGLKAVDQPRAMHLVELALDMAQNILAPRGDFLVKVFHGEGFDEVLRLCRKKFEKVVIRKPEASRARSAETYLLARGYRA